MKLPEALTLVWVIAHNQDPVLSFEEMNEIAPEAREVLLSTGLLVPCAATTHVLCLDCREGHSEEVESVTYPDGATYLFIYCPECGRVDVPPERLLQWAPRYDVVADLIAAALGTRGGCRELLPGRLWDLGFASGPGVSGPVWLGRQIDTHFRPRVPAGSPSVLFTLGARPRDGLGAAPERVFEVCHLVHIEDGRLCFNADAVRAHLAGCASAARQAGTEAAPAATIQALHADVRQIIDQTAPLPAAVAAVLRNTTAIAGSAHDLRRENAELQELARGGVMKFATRIEADDFRAFAAVMLTGNRNRAARDLGIPQRTFYDRVDSWHGRGADYERMCRMVEWRKKSGRRIKVRLDDSLLGTEVDGAAENPETIRDVLTAMRDGDTGKSHDDLLRDILQAIAGQNAGNWQSVRAELVAILEEEIQPQ